MECFIQAILHTVKKTLISSQKRNIENKKQKKVNSF